MKYTVTNAGTGDIEKFSVVDDLPEGLVTIEGSKNLDFAVDGLEAGQTRAFEARLLATRAGEFSSHAVAKAANFDLQARSANTSTRVRAAELNAEIEGPRSIYSGQPATFVGRVTNTGDFAANDVRVSVRWPAQAQLARLTDPRMEAADQNRNRPQGSNGENETNPDNGSQPQVIKDIQNANTGQDQENQSNAQNQNQDQNRGNDQNNKISDVRMDEEQFVIGTLEPNQTATFEYVVQPYEMSQISTEIVAQYACDLGDAYELEQVKTATMARATANAEVIRLAALRVLAVDDRDPVQQGQEVTYTVIVTNQGDAPDSKVEIRAELPEGLEFVRANGPTEHRQEGARVIFEPLDTLGPGDDIRYTVTAKVKGDGDIVFKAFLNSESLRTEVASEEPTRLFTGQATN